MKIKISVLLNRKDGSIDYCSVGSPIEKTMLELGWILLGVREIEVEEEKKEVEEEATVYSRYKILEENDDEVMVKALVPKDSYGYTLTYKTKR